MWTSVGPSAARGPGLDPLFPEGTRSCHASVVPPTTSCADKLDFRLLILRPSNFFASTRLVTASRQRVAFKIFLVIVSCLDTFATDDAIAISRSRHFSEFLFGPDLLLFRLPVTNFHTSPAAPSLACSSRTTKNSNIHYPTYSTKCKSCDSVVACCLRP